MTCIGPIDLLLYLINRGECRDFLSQTFMADGIPPWKDYLIALGLTLLIEAPIYAFFLCPEFKRRKLLLVVLFINLLTHPAVWYLWPSFLSSMGVTIGGYLAVSEIFAPVAEMLALKFVFRVNTKKAILGATLANLVSWWVGIYLLAQLTPS